jgi:hypothetical protein
MRYGSPAEAATHHALMITDAETMTHVGALLLLRSTPARQAPWARNLFWGPPCLC